MWSIAAAVMLNPARSEQHVPVAHVNAPHHYRTSVSTGQIIAVWTHRTITRIAGRSVLGAVSGTAFNNTAEVDNAAALWGRHATTWTTNLGRISATAVNASMSPTDRTAPIPQASTKRVFVPN